MAPTLSFQTKRCPLVTTKTTHSTHLYISHTTTTTTQKNSLPFHSFPCNTSPPPPNNSLSKVSRQRASTAMRRKSGSAPAKHAAHGLRGAVPSKLHLSPTPIYILSISFLCNSLAQTGRIVALRKAVAQRAMILVRRNAGKKKSGAPLGKGCSSKKANSEQQPPLIVCWIIRSESNAALRGSRK
jgi:hypothetical protein